LERIIVGIDVGTTKVCTLVGEVSEEGVLRIVGVGVVPSRGLRKGMVVNVNEATDVIATSVERAERFSGYHIESAFVGIAGGHISSLNSRGVVAVSHDSIVQSDVDRALEAAQAIAIPHNREIIHVIPSSFVLDGQEGVRDPIGLRGFRLEVEAHIVTGAVASIHNLVKCVQGAGVEVDDLILAPLASSEAVLTAAEREMGVVLADIGGGTTDIAIFIEGSIWHSSVLPIGGNHLTNDVAVGLRTPFANAEDVKVRYGYAIPDHIPPNETIDFTAFGEGSRQSVSRRYLSEIIEARAEEIFNLILQEVKRSGYDGLLPAGVVLSGGVANLAGLKDLGREVLKLPVRVGAPHDLEGLVDIINSPAYATGVGLLLWGMKHAEAAPPSPPEDPIRRFIRWLRKAFFPG